MKLEIYNTYAGSVLSHKSAIYQLFLDFWKNYVRKNNPKRLTIGFPIVNHWFWSHFGERGCGTLDNFSQHCINLFPWFLLQNDRTIKLYCVKKIFFEIRIFWFPNQRFLNLPTGLYKAVAGPWWMNIHNRSLGNKNALVPRAAPKAAGGMELGEGRPSGWIETGSLWVVEGK